MPNRLLRILSILIFPLLFSSNFLQAQDTGLGLKAGLNFSSPLNNFEFTSVDLELQLDPSFSTGYHLGFIYRNRFAKNFRFQAEPAFLKIGAKYNETFTFRGFEFQNDSESRLLYLHLPLLLELTTTPPDLEEFPKPWEETTYHLTFGLYGSYLLDARFYGINSGSPIGVDFEEEFSNDVTSRHNRYDAGIVLGGGLEYGYQNKIGIESRLTLGLIDTQNKERMKFKPDNLFISVAIYYIL